MPAALGPWWPTAAYLVGMVLLFVGERMVGGVGALRMALSTVGLMLAVFSLGLRSLRWASAGTPEKAVHGRQAVFTAVGLVAVLMWALQGAPGEDLLSSWFTTESAQARMRGVLGSVWPLVWLLATVPMVFVEASFGSMANHAVERWRIIASARSGLVVVLALATLAFVNYTAAELEWKSDVSYQKRLTPSEATEKIIAGLGAPVEITLFYPPAHDVARDLLQYFSAVDALSEQIHVTQVDHAREPVLAKKLRASGNGVVALSQGEKNRLLRPGLEEAGAKRMLSKLDAEFQKELIKLTGKERVAYFTTGHGERHWTLSDQDKEEHRAGISDLKLILERLNYRTKELGVAQGLAGEIPDDATVVFVVGPRESLLPAEVQALVQYFKRGGRLAVFADPENDAELNPLLETLGLKMQRTRLANERLHAKMRFNESDRHLLYSNSFSSHPSVTTLSRMSSRVAVVLLEVGYLEAATGADLPKATFTIRSMPETFADLNGNARFDTATEKRRIYDVAAAVSGKRPDAAAGDKGQDAELRAVVVADSDCVSDAVFRNAGNTQMAVDAVNWLVGEEAASGELDGSEDAKIVHTKEDDVMWFWGTIFGIPLLVLGVGLTAVRRRRVKGGV